MIPQEFGILRLPDLTTSTNWLDPVGELEVSKHKIDDCFERLEGINGEARQTA